jgi:hypothetical protein
VSLIVLALVVITQQSVKAQTDPELEKSFQKFRTECKEELGLSENDNLTMVKMADCSKVLSNTDFRIQEMVFKFNGYMKLLKDRANAMRGQK